LLLPAFARLALPAVARLGLPAFARPALPAFAPWITAALALPSKGFRTLRGSSP
jgi:hypothetical protein